MAQNSLCAWAALSPPALASGVTGFQLCAILLG